MKKKDLIFEQTCIGCPEQYNLLYEGKIIGYLRLRHGYFRADYISSKGSITVYEAYPDGDGIFESYERKKYLNKARKAIKKAYLEEHTE